MATLTVNGDGILQSYAPQLTTVYSRLATSGFASYPSGVVESWQGIGLTYPLNLLSPSGGTLTSIQITKNGSLLWSLTDFSIPITSAVSWENYLDRLISRGDVINVYGGRGDDILPIYSNSKVVDGFGGTDTLILGATYGRYTFSNIVDGSLTISNGTVSVDVRNVEFFEFTDRTLSFTQLQNAFSPTDTTAPTLVSISPADESLNVAIGANLVLTFSETIAKGTGTLVLKNSAGTTIESFNVATSSAISVAGSTLTVNPTSDLAYSTGYRLEIPSGAVKDSAGNSYAGTTTYNFTTAANPNAYAEVSRAELAKFPYPSIGVIIARWDSGESVQGTAVVVGKNDVLTAMHVVYDPVLGWADDLEFYFGADYNSATGQFEFKQYSLTTGFTWVSSGYNSSVYDDSDNQTNIQREAQYDIAVIGLSKEIGLETGYFGLDPARDTNGQSLIAAGYPEGSTGLVVQQVLVDKSSSYGIYTSAVDIFGRGASGGPLYTSDGYLVGIKSTSKWWSDIGFIYDYILSTRNNNDYLLGIKYDDYSYFQSSSNDSVLVGTPKGGEINFDDDIDYLKVSLSAGQQYTIAVSGVTLDDPYLEVYSSDKVRVASNDNFGAGFNSSLSYTPSKSDFFYIRVTHSNATTKSTGTYQVSVSTKDTNAPTLVSASPADEASGVAIGANLVLTFSEAIAKGTGTLVLKNSAGTTIESFDVATSSAVTISGSTLTVNPTSNLAYSTSYKLEIPSGAIKDTAGNSYAGTTAYNFTTSADSTVVSATRDEQDTAVGNLSTAYSDAPASTSTTFTLAIGQQNVAKGLLNPGLLADTDSYKLGELSAGTYKFTAKGATWLSSSDFSSSITPTLALYDESGKVITTSTTGVLEYSVPSKGNYFLYVTGAGNQKSQYEVYYEAVQEGKQFTGDDGDNRIDGTGGGDLIQAGGGNDVITGGAGDDSIDGGSGFDTAIWGANSSNFAVSFASGTWTLRDNASGLGTDTVKNVENLQFNDKSVIIQSESHGSYTDLPPELYQFFIVAFNAAPGVTYMNQLAEAYRFGLSVKEIVDIYVTKSQFTDLYPTTLTNRELALRLVDNIVKDSASTDVKAGAVQDIEAAMSIGYSRADVLFTVFGNLGQKPFTDATWGNTAKFFANEIAVAKAYTEVMDQSTTDLATLRAALTAVTKDTSATTDTAAIELAIKGLFGSSPASAATPLSFASLHGEDDDVSPEPDPLANHPEYPELVELIEPYKLVSFDVLF